MPIEYLKKANPRSVDHDEAITHAARTILDNVERNGESAARKYALQFDGYSGDIVMGPDVFLAASRALSAGVKDDIAFAHARVRDFAQRQRDTLLEFESESIEGVVTGQRLVPVGVAGCYVPGGRYAHAASAIMSVCTAKVAGVPRIVATSPAAGGQGIHPAILFAMQLSGADTVLALGGVQGVAALAYGLFSGCAADVIVGPGNQYVAEAKRLLFGRVGIDVLAGPTESAIIADAHADPLLVAADLVGQAEHGVDSPVWLFTTSRDVGQAVMARVPQLIEALPEPASSVAAAAWRDHAEVVYCPTREDMAEISDQYAPEHLQVMAQDLDWWLARLTNYGSLFLGEETTVTYGDKCSGPNHIIPTRKAARYSGGLSVGKFIKTLTWQRMTRRGGHQLGPVAARISRLEGMEAHARSVDVRMQKYFPDEVFDLSVSKAG